MDLDLFADQLLPFAHPMDGAVDWQAEMSLLTVRFRQEADGRGVEVFRLRGRMPRRGVG